MKLLLDENLSRSLVDQLNREYPGSSHITSESLQSADDAEIWRFAAANAFTIVSKDTDFVRLSEVHGHPPKVIVLRIGNASTLEVQRLLTAAADQILAFDLDEEASILILNPA